MGKTSNRITKILITGAQGQLAYELEQFATQHHVIALTHQQLDITQHSAVEKALETFQPDVVINTAAMTQVDQCETEREKCWQANVEAVRYLAEACQMNQVHLVHVSTDFIFDGSHGPLDENEKPHPLSFYGESKLAGELIIQESLVDWTILRTVLVYGVTQDMSRSNIVLWVKKNLEEGKAINVVNDQWRTPTLAEDLATGCFLAATQKAKGIFNVSGEQMMTPYDIAIATADFFKLDKSLIKETDSFRFTQPAKRPAKTGFIIDKAKRELGFRPHSFIEGLAILRKQIIK